jgi:hypothetical protein
MVILALSGPEAGELICALDALLVELASELAEDPEEPVRTQLDEAFTKLVRVRTRLSEVLATPRLHAVC